ncbi:Histidine protein methyltransferase 1-like protein [Dichanthelium oligosanthes]|uniref:protein-histidine N-methyltransferase n=1 Tax=Dichanthelium oligosanthes TaxID=888268 RepID=A0A1E5WJU8_9POAL|nr:Histidine protein methyltransferase 1-like protein [Dichanthelium oligosanthes]
MEGTEAAKNSTTTGPTFASPLFSFSNPSSASFGFDSGAPPPPPLPAVEVQLSEESPVAAAKLEPVVVDDSLTIYKGRVSTSDVFGVKDSDLVPGKYEAGGLKLWEGSLDLVKTLNSDIKEDRLLLKGKHVLELGCGHGLPGIFAGLKGASLIHFQDFNAEVLKCLTIPNVKVNLFKESPEGTCTSRSVGFFAGDWSEMDKLLLCGDAEQDKTISGNTEDKTHNGYDIILMAETVYALSSLPNLYRLIKKCLHYPGGVVYMAGKKHYFGVGGGTRQFLRLVEEDGTMQPERLNDVADGSSNVREDAGGVGVGGGGSSQTGGLFQYQRLECRDEGAALRSRWRWLPAALSGKAASPCLFHVKKLKWGRITSAIIPRKVAEFSAKIRHASGATEADLCPAVIFMSPWGLPVLSRPLLAGHKSRYHHHGRETS